MNATHGKRAPRLLTGPRARGSYAHTLPVLAGLREEGFEAVLVGGGIRDLLLGREASDWDIATAARPEAVLAIWPDAIPTGIRHGTVTLVMPPHTVEITTYRTEGPYSDGRRPDWVRLDATLPEDLSRRDFTVNALAFDPGAGLLWDPEGGLDDLEGRLIRTVGDPDQRFREDGLRPLRGIRLAAVLDFSVDPPTLEAMERARPGVAAVAVERIRDELLKLLEADRPSRGIELLRRTGILELILPELLEGLGMEQNRHHAYDVYEHSLRTLDSAPVEKRLVRVAALLHDVGKPRTRKVVEGEGTFHGHEGVGGAMTREILDRLRFSRADRDHVAGLVEGHMFHYTPEWSDGAVRRFLRRIGEDALEDLFDLRRADDAAHGMGPRDPAGLEALIRRIAELRSRDEVLKVGQLAVDGHDVMQALDLESGPEVGEVLEALLERVLDDPSLNHRDTLLDLARQVRRSS